MADITWITARLAVGGGIWTRENLAAISRAAITHIINTQVEFDDYTLLAPSHYSPPNQVGEKAAGNYLKILHLPMDDDFQPKPVALLRRAVEFALAALAQPNAKVLVHCASGVHRGPLVALAILRALGLEREEALRLIQARRPQADFPEPYLDSVGEFLAEWQIEPQA